MFKGKHILSPKSQAALIRCFGTSKSKLGSRSVPNKALNSWERGARLVKNTDVENQYLDHIRDMHDPTLHLKTIEDELKGTIGKALGKQGEKILVFLREMEAERKLYDSLVAEHGPNSDITRRSAQKYNLHRKDCLNARWELIVHRQAAGFIVNNHKFVAEKFPIGEPIPLNDEAFHGNRTLPKSDKSSFGDQLDWWQKYGRWR